jgi:hypothetical protein
MTPPPDDVADIAWVPQAQILDLAEISRATLNSWIKAGLDIPEAAAAYKVADLVKLLIFAGARKHLTPQQIAAAWVDLARSGKATAITNAARELGSEDNFDLVIDVKYKAFEVVRSDEELLSAVRHPTAPRAIVVIDLAERMRDAISYFFRSANKDDPPSARKRGRPRKSKDHLQVVSGDGGR